MTEFEPRTSDIGSNHSYNRATTNASDLNYLHPDKWAHKMNLLCG